MRGDALGHHASSEIRRRASAVGASSARPEPSVAGHGATAASNRTSSSADRRPGLRRARGRGAASTAGRTWHPLQTAGAGRACAGASGHRTRSTRSSMGRGRTRRSSWERQPRPAEHARLGARPGAVHRARRIGTVGTSSRPRHPGSAAGTPGSQLAVLASASSTRVAPSAERRRRTRTLGDESLPRTTRASTCRLRYVNPACSNRRRSRSPALRGYTKHRCHQAPSL